MKRGLSLAVAILVGAGSLSAQTQVLPTELNGWFRVNGQVINQAINAEVPYTDAGDNGSLELYMASPSSKATYQFNFATAQSLTALTALSFDWYRLSTSTASAHFAPVFNLMVRVGSANYLLEWEYVYNVSGAAPTGSWQHADILGGKFWAYQTNLLQTGWINTSCGRKSGSQAFWTLTKWLDSICLANAQVTGIQISAGSGWNGSFDGYVDNVKFAFGDGYSEWFDFQTQFYEAPIDTVPEPATMTLLATGLAGVAAARRRRKS